MPMNTTFGGFDDSVKLNAIQAIELAIQRTEETCSSITGVFRERLGGIEQKDAVTNVQTGIKNSALITKQYYQLMDLMTREILLDSLNLAKIVYKNGITGSIILGERLNKVFTALPEYFTLTDHDIHIADSQTSIKEQTTIEQLQVEFIKAGIIDPEVIIDMVGTKSLTDMKLSVKNAIIKKREENNQLQQVTQQAQQLQEELKKMQQENQKLQQQIQKNNDVKTQMEQERLAFDKELGWYKENNLKEYNEAKIEWEQKRIQLEAAEMFDNNPHNDTVKKD